MKRLLSILCITGILLQHLAPICVMLGFTMHRDEIARTLCINRKKASSCCKGSCYLAKSLKKEAGKEKSSGTQEKMESEWALTNLIYASERPAVKNYFKNYTLPGHSPEPAPPLAPPPCII